MQLKEGGFTSTPGLAKRFSLLDIDWTEKIVMDGLSEIFLVFSRVVKEHKLIGEKKDKICQVVSKEWKSFAAKSKSRERKEIALRILWEVLYTDKHDKKEVEAEK